MVDDHPRPAPDSRRKGGIRAPVGKGATRGVFGLVTTLPHSAAHATVFAFSKTMPDFLPAFSGTLCRLDGGPEAMVVDRDSSIVVPRSRPGRLHREVAALFRAFRIRPGILAPRRPESKGQVERTIGHLETSFLPRRSFGSLADLQEQHDRWAAEVAFQRSLRRLEWPRPLRAGLLGRGGDLLRRPRERHRRSFVPAEWYWHPAMPGPSQIRRLGRDPINS